MYDGIQSLEQKLSSESNLNCLYAGVCDFIFQKPILKLNPHQICKAYRLIIMLLIYKGEPVKGLGLCCTLNWNR